MGGDNSGMGDSHAAPARKFYEADHCVPRTVRLFSSWSRTRFLSAERGCCCPLTADCADENGFDLLSADYADFSSGFVSVICANLRNLRIVAFASYVPPRR